MTPADLRQRLALAGMSQGELARRIGISARHVRRLVAEDSDGVPDHLVPAVLQALAGAPDDSWIFGDGDATGGEYAVHLHQPRFVARLVVEDDADDASTADLLSGLTLSLGDGLVLCQIRWIDPPAHDDDGLQAIIRSCLAALERVQARDERA